MSSKPLEPSRQDGHLLFETGAQRPRRWRREKIFWSFQAMFWLAIAAVVLGFNRAVRPDEPTPWGPVAIRTATALVASGFVDWLFQRPALRALDRPARWTLLVAVSFGTLMASMLFLMALRIGGPSNWSGEATLGPLVPRLVGIGLWSAIYCGIDLLDELHQSEVTAERELRRLQVAANAIETRALRAEAAAREHELLHLQEQMNPHFLFNALNAVAANKDDPAAVEQVTQDLAEYLRFSLRQARTCEPLSRELDALQTYLAVQRARFRDNLVCRVVADRAAHAVLVPPMLIQPLLENALHYGAKTSSMPLRVNVSATVTGGWLEVIVENSGRWVPPDPKRSPGTGIRSIRKRLELVADKTATVDTHLEPDKDGGWVRVVVRLPVTLPHDQSPLAAAGQS
ncbi:MAG: histidine kinase [Planctomycetes bacterium]|nr:histidine kinase [Planctomycetota bacterium]